MSDYLLLQRSASAGKATPGRLYFVTAGGSTKRFVCFTLEDLVRNVKIPRETAIPAGSYEVIMSMSPRFGRILPEILKVPNFSGVRMHGGNTSLNTEGCPLLGLERDKPDTIRNCAGAVSATIAIIKSMIKKEGRCILLIENHTKTTEI